MTLAFRDNPLDRCGNLRSDATWLHRQLASPRLRLIQLSGDRVAMDGDALLLDGAARPADCVFLGLDADGTPWAAQDAAADAQVKDLRSLMIEGSVPAAQLGILAQARALLHWHQSHRFCARCGAASAMADAGYRRHCAACSTDHFPRTDPVVIIAVRRPGHVLLGRQTSWAAGMYSTLAGFMEPGETIEDAARREVFEEAGIRVGEIHYAASQPWPFPASLMIGLIGEALTSDITVDPKELEQARWFADDEVRLMLNGTHPEGFWASRPQAIAHALIRQAVQAS